MTWPSSASGIATGQAGNRQHGQAFELAVVVDVARREDQEHRLRLQAAAHESQRLRGRSIEPLAVVDQRDDRPLPAGLRQEVEDG